MTLLRRLVVVLTATTLLGAPAAAQARTPTDATPSVAASGLSVAGASASVVAPCLSVLAPAGRGAGSGAGGAREVPTERVTPHWRSGGDTTDVTAADLAALPAIETTPDVVRREVAPRLPGRVQVPVYVHVIKGTHRGEANRLGPRKLRYLVAVLNAGFTARQSSQSTTTRYRFVLRGTDYTKRDGWYHAYNNGPRDQRAKRRLHRGGAGSLNIYVNGGGPSGYPMLGWSRFPWQYAGAPRLDNVSVNVAALPGGRASGYDLGDTVIHETGHWLGLFHTFEGGCGSRGDLVADTAAEGEPSYYCETTRDTCPAPGTDPVRNFMDYSLDRCMSLFTPGQVGRMDAAYEKWRS